jgi:diketogulonate reductase-like aldo/keto reductase
VKTLKDLRLEYLDCYLIHWPLAFLRKKSRDDNNNNSNNSNNNNDEEPSPEDEGWLEHAEDPDVPGKVLLRGDVGLEETWREMERLVDDGLVRCIGVSNFNVSKIKRLLAFARIKPAFNQVIYCIYSNW